jgi:hypothetical protein
MDELWEDLFGKRAFGMAHIAQVIPKMRSSSFLGFRAFVCVRGIWSKGQRLPMQTTGDRAPQGSSISAKSEAHDSLNGLKVTSASKRPTVITF